MRETLTCSDCGLPIARREDDNLIIYSRHHGRIHANIINISSLFEDEIVDFDLTELNFPDSIDLI